MLDRLFLKPAPQPAGEPPLKVRKPVNGHLLDAGEWVPNDSYWLRRLTDGDVVQVDPPEVAAWLGATAPDANAAAPKVAAKTNK